MLQYCSILFYFESVWSVVNQRKSSSIYTGLNVFFKALNFRFWQVSQSFDFFIPVYPDGRVCISILHAPGDDPMGYETSAERWSPVQSVEKILLSVVSMLAGKFSDLISWSCKTCPVQDSTVCRSKEVDFDIYSSETDENLDVKKGRNFLFVWFFLKIFRHSTAESLRLPLVLKWKCSNLY